jgi:hypothetical protein
MEQLHVEQELQLLAKKDVHHNSQIFASTKIVMITMHALMILVM